MNAHQKRLSRRAALRKFHPADRPAIMDFVRRAEADPMLIHREDTVYPTLEHTLRDIAQAMTGDQHRRLISMRGGCSCNVSSPCGPHSEPLTLEEADELGLMP